MAVVSNEKDEINRKIQSAKLRCFQNYSLSMIAIDVFAPSCYAQNRLE